MQVEEKIKNRNNNLTLIKLVAALFVILSHAYPLTGSGNDLLGRVTNGTIDFGKAAVCVFFFYGGFLITKSAEKKNWKAYFQSRVLRLFPQMMMVTVLLAFVVGPLITSLPVSEYFGNSGTYRYLLNSFCILVHNLPGVFTNNPYDATVNGPLWTQPLEVVCYIGCFIAVKIHLADQKRMKWTVPFFITGYAFCLYYFRNVPVILTAMRPMGMFYMGVLYYVYQDKIPNNTLLFIMSILGLGLCFALQYSELGLYLFFPYMLMYLGFVIPKMTNPVEKIGDFSYGMYLTAWPIQQICIQYGIAKGPILNFVIAAVISSLCGIVLMKIEQKIIRK